MTTNAPAKRPISKVRIGTPALVGVVLALSAPVAAATQLLMSPGSTHQDSVSNPYTGEIDKVVVKGDSGSVDLRSDAPADTALVETDRQWRGDKAKPPTCAQALVHGTLSLNCNEPSDGSVSWILHVPAAVAVTIDVTDGAVNVTGVAGAIDITTTNGAIDGRQLGGGGAVFTSTNGAIDAKFSGQPTSITASSTNGSIDITTNGSPYGVKPLPGKHDLSRNGGKDLKNTGAYDGGPDTIALWSENGSVTVRDPNS